MLKVSVRKRSSVLFKAFAIGVLASLSLAVFPSQAFAEEKPNTSQISSSIANSTQKARSDAKLSSLKEARSLNNLALSLAQEAAANQSTEQSDNLPRLLHEGWASWAENVGYVSGVENPAESLFNNWRNNPKNNSNILNSSFTDFGVGSYIDSQNKVWSVQVFVAYPKDGQGSSGATAEPTPTTPTPKPTPAPNSSSAPSQSSGSTSSESSKSPEEIQKDLIREIQQLLTDMGYSEVGDINGEENDSTILAVGDFQKDIGVPQTGALDEETRDILKLKKAEGWMKPVQDEATIPSETPQESQNETKNSSKTFLYITAVASILGIIILSVVLYRILKKDKEKFEAEQKKKAQSLKKSQKF